MTPAHPAAARRAPWLAERVSLRAARSPRAFAEERLLHLDPATGAFRDRAFADLPSLLRPGDVLVVNDAATLPASLPLADGRAEVRLAARLAGGDWLAVVFGTGDFRIPTELRPEPPPLLVGERLDFGALVARVVAVDPELPRLVTLRFELEGAALWSALHRAGRPVQYSHVPEPLELWDVQTRFGVRPWAVEMPSAGRPLSWRVLGELRRGGVGVVALTHSAGLSSTGTAELDARFPLPEPYEIPDATVRAVLAARQRGSRVVAVGTTVVRALESGAAEPSGLRPGAGVARLRLTPSHRPRVVDGLLSGLHEPGTSHFDLLSAFAPASVLEAALGHAARAGYVQHEFGDGCLILADRAGELAEGVARANLE